MHYRKEIYIEISDEHADNINNLLNTAGSPMQMLREGKQWGIKGLKRFIGITGLFILTNTILLIMAIARLVMAGPSFGGAGWVALVLLAGLGFTIYAGYRAYQLVMLDVARVIYESFTPVFRQLSLRFVEKAEVMMKEKTGLGDAQLQRTVDVSSVLQEKYGRAPRLVRNGINMILSRIPLSTFINEARTQILSGDREAASDYLFTKTDNFVRTNIFGDISMGWALWLWIANILILGFFIYKIR